MTSLRYRARSGLARVSRAVAACLVALAFSFAASDFSASAGFIQSNGLATLSTHRAADQPGSGDPVDAGIVLHVHCGYHQVMRAEPVAFELVRTADRIVYPIQVESLSSRSASPLRRPPRA